MLAPLPIDAALPGLLAQLARRPCAVVVAPPGSGKTTRVPPALLSMGPGKVLVLQPRRVAARLAARRLAEERGERVGGVVGYRTRFERRVGPTTRLEVLTEGLLLRRLQADPFLEGVAAVVLDEFHERSLDIDLALALLREVQQDARPGLLLVVMSATLDPSPVASFLGGEERCSVFQVAGRRFPVEQTFDPRPSKLWLSDRVAAAVRQELAVQTEPGHVLVFLPGVGEIEAARRCLRDDRERPLPTDVSLHALHGSLPARDQDAALAPERRRKVVLATNIAETSITLEGVRSVVDTGLAKVPRFDLGTGVERLELQRIPRSSADQRAGRAGRTGPGRCRRLWTESEDRQLVPAHVPAVRRVDLAPVFLQLAAWGAEPSTFRWFERPSADALSAAASLLTRLGAVDESGITPRGRALATLPLHPRLGSLLLAGAQAGVLASAATVAALLASRDIVRRQLQDELEDDDIALRLRLVALRELGERLPRSVDGGAIDEVRRVRDQLVRAAERLAWEDSAPKTGAHPLTAALLQAFPDRVALRRAGGERFLLASGTGCRLSPHSLARAELLLALSLGVGPRGGEAQIRLALPLRREWLDAEDATELAFDQDREAVAQRRVRRYGALVLDERPVEGKADPAAVAECLERAARRHGAERLLEFDRDASELLGRIATLRPLFPELDLPDPGDANALLPALCAGRRSFAQLRKANVHHALRSMLSWKHRAALDELAPERIRVPSGSKIRLRYDPQGAEPPVLAARIQQLFGMNATPRIARGRLGVLVHLLAPNNRPAQVTSDLASFWVNTYPAVRKDLRGRYPKHSWPEDPASATPEDRPRRRR